MSRKRKRAGFGNLVTPSMPRYDPLAVQKAIESSSRHGPRIGKREAGLIHRLLKGRR